MELHFWYIDYTGYPESSLNSFNNSCIVFIDSLGFKVMLSGNKDSFIYSFLISMPFIYLSCLIILAVIANAIFISS